MLGRRVRADGGRCHGRRRGWAVGTVGGVVSMLQAMRTRGADQVRITFIHPTTYCSTKINYSVLPANTYYLLYGIMPLPVYPPCIQAKRSPIKLQQPKVFIMANAGPVFVYVLVLA